MIACLVALGMEIPKMPRDISRPFRKRLKIVLKKVGEFWHDKHRPGHFARGAYNRYNYELRDPEYLEDKKERRGPRPDLVFSGKTNRYTAHGERVTSTARMATVRMDVPNYKGPNAKQVRKEIVMVNESDRKSLQARMLDLSERLLGIVMRAKGRG